LYYWERAQYLLKVVNIVRAAAIAAANKAIDVHGPNGVRITSATLARSPEDPRRTGGRNPVGAGVMNLSIAVPPASATGKSKGRIEMRPFPLDGRGNGVRGDSAGQGGAVSLYVQRQGVNLRLSGGQGDRIIRRPGLGEKLPRFIQRHGKGLQKSNSALHNSFFSGNVSNKLGEVKSHFVNFLV
jgi:hypothetical protein